VTTEAFLSLSQSDRVEALNVAATASGRPAHILEKDVWVVWTLDALFDSPFGKHLVFKGGTSLSKVYKAINRFSEDIDVTYDIREIAADLVKGAGDDPLPKTKSEGRRWTDEIRKERLPNWLKTAALPHLQTKVTESKLDVKLRADDECIYVEYAPTTGGKGYVAPTVKIEFGARSTGEPSEDSTVVCDAAQHLKEIKFPTASVRVMHVDRTLWEKLTAIHVFCLQGKVKDRQARHWYDVAQLDATGHTNAGLNNQDVAQRVAEHKQWFFSANDSEGKPIDYSAAIHGGLVLLPKDEALEALAGDYRKMIEDGLFLDAPPEFGAVLERCRRVQERANKRETQIG
jgi:hypothetical protein